MNIKNNNKIPKLISSNISLTKKAELKILYFILKKNNLNLKLRIFVKGGGCSGFEYGFLLDELVNNDDIIISKNKVKIIIDFISYQYLIGSKIDYNDEIKESKFIISNPNATTTCSCGSSFSI